MKLLHFKDNDTMHTIGLGTWKAKGKEVKDAVKDAVHAGYRHIDTASVYGNESEIGEALQEIFAEGKIFREDLWITSKLWNNAHQKGNIIPALEESLKKLQLDYLDLYLVHWPVAFRHNAPSPKKTDDYLSLEEVPLEETWADMELAKKEELALHIGVSNFSIKKLKHLIKNSSVKPEMNQIEMHPLLQQKEMLEFCRSENILLTAYSPLGSGDRSEKLKGENEPNLMEIPEIIELAKKHQASAAQILIAWHLHRGTAVIPKSTTKENIINNFQAASIELEEADMKKIEKLDKHYRFITGDFFKMPEKGYISIYDE